MASLSTDPPQQQSAITLEHFVCTAFDARLPLELPSAPDQLAELLGNIARDCGHSGEIKPDVVTFLRAQLYTGFNLHTLSQLVETVVFTLLPERDEPIDAQRLLSGQSKGLTNDLRRITYRGHQLSISGVEKWLRQFSLDLRPIAMHLIRRITRDYYVSAADYHGAIQYLIDKSGLAKAQSVTFCKWQAFGRSGPRVAHQMKNQGHLRSVSDIDLSNPSSWNAAPTETVFVIADDFVGSGKTLSSLFQDGTLKRLLAERKDALLRVLVIAGFERGLDKVKSSMNGLAELKVFKIFNEGDRCLGDSSQILPRLEAQCALRAFCKDKLPHSIALGYNKLASLVVFPDTVPNNSLGILWYDNSDKWYPLFPASGLPTDSQP